MPTIYPIEYPTDFGVSEFNIDLAVSVAVSESTFTKQQQVQVHQGEAWQINFNINLLTREQGDIYKAFLLRLRGREGTFTMTVPGHEQPKGVATGTPVVNGADQTGDELVVEGFTPSVSGILKAGDYVQLGSGSSTRLHCVLEDVDSDATGEVTLSLAPRIIVAPVDGADLIVSNAKGMFRLTQNENPSNIKPPVVVSYGVTASEVR